MVGRSRLQLAESCFGEGEFMRHADELVVVTPVALAEIVPLFAHRGDLEAERDDLLTDSVEIRLQVRNSAQDVAALILEAALFGVFGVSVFSQLPYLGDVTVELFAKCCIVGTRRREVRHDLRGMLEECSARVSRTDAANKPAEVLTALISASCRSRLLRSS